MLIEFAVENFRSIKDEARLSLVAAPGKKHKDTHLIAPKMNKGVHSTPLVRSSVIYGANAAGKSNLLRAFEAMKRIVCFSARAVDPLPVTPFRFDPETRSKPTTFEIVGIVDQMRFQYGFSATPETVVSEWLYAWPRGRMQIWFERTSEAGEESAKCKFGNQLAGNKGTWRRATRPNTLLLSTACLLNSEQLRPIFEWFHTKLHVGSSAGWRDEFSTQWCRGDRKSRVIEFLRSADLAIDDLRIEEKDFPLEMLLDHMPSDVRNRMMEDFSEAKVLDVYLQHNTGRGQPVDLELEEESHGTRKMFRLAGPWLDTLEQGHIIVFDELHANLHPALVRFLVNQFNDPAVNTKDAQLVFTTHDTSILDENIFRRDQIWFCDRNEYQETRLFPLTDFHPRRGVENLEHSYLAGRYGALPYIRSTSKKLGG